MKYKALVSDKQFFGFKGSTYRANNGIFETEDKDVIEFLNGHFAWQPLEKVIKKIEKEIEDIKTDIVKPEKKKAKKK